MDASQHHLMINQFLQMLAKKVFLQVQNKLNAPLLQSMLVKVVLHQVIKLRWFQLAKILFKETQKEVIGGPQMIANRQ